METENDLNLFDIPITALRQSTRQMLVNELNKTKVLPSEDGLPRDWRGLAHLTGGGKPAGDSPADQILTMWGRQPDANIGLLEELLGRLDRWDIVDDVHNLLREDAKVYKAGKSRCSEESQKVDSDIDNHVLTFDDIRRLEEGLELQLYDALLLYADQDEAFARQMLDRLENDYHLKVCLKDNLVGGLAFEHQGILKLISERCRRVIIILSRSFFDSPVNRFSVSFAQALAIEKRQRIIIPCIYERAEMELPQEIRLLHKLDYNRAGLRDYNFWERLRASVVQPPPTSPRLPGVKIRELNSNEVRHLKSIKAASNLDVPLCPQVNSGFKSASYKSNSDYCEVKEKHNSTTSLHESLKISSSTLSLPEKAKVKTKSPSDFIRKLFRSEKSKSKSKKVAVKLC